MFAAPILWLALTFPLVGQAPPVPVPPQPLPAIGIAGPATISDRNLGLYTVVGGEVKVAWLVMPQTSHVVIDQQLVLTGPAGSYTVIAFAVQSGQPVILQQGVQIGPPPPPPVPPTPPVPPPPPVPPQPPTPPTPPAPIPDRGLRVLILYDTATLSKLPPPQLAALYDQSLRQFLNSVTATDPTTHVHEARFYDPKIVLTGESDVWKSLLARPHPSLPWIVISNGETGFEGALPGTAAEITSLVKGYAPK